MILILFISLLNFLMIYHIILEIFFTQVPKLFTHLIIIKVITIIIKGLPLQLFSIILFLEVLVANNFILNL
jgi:hypothetical protein